MHHNNTDMASSIVPDYSDAPEQEPAADEEVLCELNAEFRRSKSELIHRFLKDQEELNRKFSEYELDSDNDEDEDEDEDDLTSSSAETSPRSKHSDSRECQEIFDVLQDLEDKDIPDNLSIASAVNSSSGDNRSLLEDSERVSMCDSDEDHGVEEDWNSGETSRQSPDIYCDNFYDQYSRQGVLSSSFQSETQKSSPVPSDINQRKPRRAKQSNLPRKVKKVLVKKNIRPKTSMGVRALPNNNDLLFQHEQNNQVLQSKPSSSGPRLTFNDSLHAMGARFKKISWEGGSEDHPELGRLSISASVHRLPPRSHTPGGRLCSSIGPSLNAGSRSLKNTSENSTNEKRHREGSQTRRPKGPVDLLELSRAATPVRPDSSMSTLSRLSVDMGPDPLATYRSRQNTPNPTSGPHLMRSVYSAERGGRIVMTPTLAEVKGKKRPIAVLKLPPLDSSVVNRAIGAGLEAGTSRQSSLVSPATTKPNAVPTPSAII